MYYLKRKFKCQNLMKLLPSSRELNGTTYFARSLWAFSVLRQERNFRDIVKILTSPTSAVRTATMLILLRTAFRERLLWFLRWFVCWSAHWIQYSTGFVISGGIRNTPRPATLSQGSTSCAKGTLDLNRFYIYFFKAFSHHIIYFHTEPETGHKKMFPPIYILVSPYSL